MFNDIMSICKPESLAIYEKYTRRDGVDINPMRTAKNIGKSKIIRFVI